MDIMELIKRREKISFRDTSNERLFINILKDSKYKWNNGSEIGAIRLSTFINVSRYMLLSGTGRGFMHGLISATGDTIYYIEDFIKTNKRK